jgi:hypothetical protein
MELPTRGLRCYSGTGERVMTAIQTVGIKGYDGFALALVIA